MYIYIFLLIDSLSRQRYSYAEVFIVVFLGFIVDGITINSSRNVNSCLSRTY